jgi:hypothetical protein
MNQRLKTALVYLVDIRSIILFFALFNFVLIWRWDASITFACVACPWFHPWSYLNDPTLLLAASIFVRLNRWWGSMIALVLAAMVIGYVVHLFSLGDGVMAGLRADWKIIRMLYPYFVGSWDSQFVFALIILCFSAFCLSRDILRRNAVPRSGG